MSRIERYRSILAGLTSWDYVHQCDQYIDAAEPDEPDKMGTYRSLAQGVLDAALDLDMTALREGRVGTRLQEAITAYKARLAR